MAHDFTGRIASARYYEDDSCSNPRVEHPIGELISRRCAIKAAAATAAAGFLSRLPLATAAPTSERLRADTSPSSLTFAELQHGDDPQAYVADGYDYQVLLRWGDAIISGAPAFDPLRQSVESQSKQFGYNCDYTAFLPLPSAADGSTRGLLCVNHEYNDTNLMFPGVVNAGSLETLSKELVDVEMTAHGHSVVEIVQIGRRWRVVETSPLNRRITALDTFIDVSGPAAGHPRLRTSEDPSGRRVQGTLNNCAGGVTPWGTMLICEENFNEYFSGDPAKTPEFRNHTRYGISSPSKFRPAWAKHYQRFDIEKEPHEPNRFGWVVEFDPFQPNSVPVKRTAMGRVKHEGAGLVVNHDGRVVIYCGDDERFDYVYKFVTRRPFVPGDRQANRDLLDDGTLYAARFDADGTLQWLPLVYGQGPLTAENDFHCQADVLIETRRAADLVGATPMDRPEDVEASPVTGHVFVILTNNTKRLGDQIDAANPRAENANGHILELIPPKHPSGLDHASELFRWEVFLRAGNPANPSDRAAYHPQVSSNGWFSCPDNSTFDSQGRLWLTTDSDHKLTGFGDGVYGCDTVGKGRALTKLFFRGPRGSELTGVSLTPDNRTMFVSVQHPGEEDDSDFAKPSTRWPDFQASMPPRPSVVAITRRDGGVIGG